MLCQVGLYEVHTSNVPHYRLYLSAILGTPIVHNESQRPSDALHRLYLCCLIRQVSYRTTRKYTRAPRIPVPLDQVCADVYLCSAPVSNRTLNTLTETPPAWNSPSRMESGRSDWALTSAPAASNTSFVSSSGSSSIFGLRTLLWAGDAQQFALTHQRQVDAKKVDRAPEDEALGFMSVCVFSYGWSCGPRFLISCAIFSMLSLPRVVAALNFAQSSSPCKKGQCPCVFSRSQVPLLQTKHTPFFDGVY